MKHRLTLLKISPVILAFVTLNSAQAQNTATLSVGPADTGAVYDPASFTFRAMGLKGAPHAAPSTKSVASSSANSAAEISVIPKPGFYPDDVSNPDHNPAVVTTEHHPIYVNMPPSHWGNVGAFLVDLGHSEFIHLLDQYIGSAANNRYTLGASFLALYSIPKHPLKESDILALVHAAAAVKGNGYGHLYHVFLPKGVDMCLDKTDCYSPDDPDRWTFCAFHGSATFKDTVGHVIFTLEPYQDVIGCSAPPTGTANNQLIDSTDDTLSHESFEAISDPDDAWWVRDDTFAVGNEIADMCTRAAQIGKNVYSDYGTVKLNGNRYTIQPEYSNQLHGCAYGPASPPE